MLTIQELSKQVGLTPNYITKCKKYMNDILSPHIKAGDNNKHFFDGSAVQIFDKISQLKENGLTVKAIKQEIEKNLQPIKSDINEGVEPAKAGIKTGKRDDNGLLEKLLEAHHDIAKEKEKQIEQEKRITELERQKEHYKNQYENAVKLLPEGKTPEQIKADWESNQKKKILIKDIRGKIKQKNSELKQSSGVWIWQVNKRKKITSEIDNLIEELKKLTE